MDPTYARYPFLSEARAAVRETGADLATLVAEQDRAVERGRERVERALTEGTTASEAEYSTRDELLSYPLARILVSLLDAEAAIDKYATAEATTAYQRFSEDFRVNDGRDGRIDRGRLLREFDLAGRVRPEPLPDHRRSDADPEWFRIDVGAYLTFGESDWGDDWRLVNREVADGGVRVTREELDRLLRAAVRNRVREGLPFAGIGDELADALERQLTDLQDLLADRTTETDVEIVDPSLFPPCVARLVGRAQAGEELDAPALFALLSFLAGLNLDRIHIAMLLGSGLSSRANEMLTRVADEDAAQYPPPSCQTLGAYGLCDDANGHRAVAPHPLDYYERRLREATDPVDFRDRDEPPDLRDAA